MHKPSTLPEPRIYDVRGVAVFDTRTQHDGGVAEIVAADRRAIDDSLVAVGFAASAYRRRVAADVAAIMAATPTPSSFPAPSPKPGPSKATRAARKRQKQARKAARR